MDSREAILFGRQCGALNAAGPPNTPITRRLQKERRSPSPRV